MAKRKIVWSHRARIKLYDILKFYNKRYQSNSYSGKLHRRLTKEIVAAKQRDKETDIRMTEKEKLRRQYNPSPPIQSKPGKKLHKFLTPNVKPIELIPRFTPPNTR